MNLLYTRKRHSITDYKYYKYRIHLPFIVFCFGIQSFSSLRLQKFPVLTPQIDILEKNHGYGLLAAPILFMKVQMSLIRKHWWMNKNEIHEWEMLINPSNFTQEFVHIQREIGYCRRYIYLSNCLHGFNPTNVSED